MLKQPTSVILGLTLCVLSFGMVHAQSPTDAKPVQPAPFIILKLDDLTWDSPAWRKTIGVLKEKNIKSSIGIICNSLEGNRDPYYAWIKGIQETGLVEFWNHGLTHKEWKEGEVKVQEFKGTTYEQQKDGFSKSQQLAKEKLGITFRTFGAPFNGTDESTLKVLNEDSDIKVWFYGRPADAAKLPGILNLERTRMNIENPLFVPNSQRVEEDYKALIGTRDCFTIQGHPDQWDDARFVEFVKLVEFLQAQGATFTTPYEYYLSKQKSPEKTTSSK